MNDIFKWVEPIISLVIRSFRGQREDSFRISGEVLSQLRKILSLTALLAGSLILFLLGASYFMERFLDQLDSGVFHFSNSLVFLTVFMLLSLIGIFYATKKSVWKSVLEKTPAKEFVANTGQTHSQLESAISLFILDVVKERELNREKQRAATEQK